MDWLNVIENSGFGTWVRESGSLWSYPTIIFLHSLGLSFVVGMSVALDLRLLGFGCESCKAHQEQCRSEKHSHLLDCN